MPEPRACTNCGEIMELRLGRTSNGARWPVLQCPSCWEYTSVYVGVKTGYTIEMQDAAPKFDKDLSWEMRKKRWAAKNVESNKEYSQMQAQRENKQRDWWIRYHEYMTSDTWMSLRKRVLDRDEYICQSCHRSEATQVHHLNYKHLGAEPMFDLVSVCRSCHEKITELDRSKT